MGHCATRLGEQYFRTPRTTITAFIDLLAVLQQNPTADWKALLGGVSLAPDRGGESDHSVEPETVGQGSDELVSFKL